MKKFFEEFKNFALRGNVLDMAIGIIIGIAFGKIVSSLVNDIIMPQIELILGGINLTDFKIILKQSTGGSNLVSINIGNFIQTAIDFLIVSFAIFLIVKSTNALMKKQKSKEQPPQPSKIETLLEEIRDILKNKQ